MERHERSSASKVEERRRGGRQGRGEKGEEEGEGRRRAAGRRTGELGERGGDDEPKQG